MSGPGAASRREAGVVGAGARRLEGAGKVTGGTSFTADLKVDSQQRYVKLILSHVACGTIRSIDRSAALEHPGVIDVVTGADLPIPDDTPAADLPLARTKVHYIGQPVAAIIADSPQVAADAAYLIVVEYEATAAVIDPFEAMRPDAPVVLDVRGGSNDASGHSGSTAANSESVPRPPNVTSITEYKRGDIDAAFAASETTVDATYRVAGVHQGFIEPHVVVARPEADGGITLWTPTQGQFYTRDQVAKRIGLPSARLKVIPVAVGGGFGSKILLLEPLMALLAMRVRQTLVLDLTRSEEFLLGRPAPGATIELKLGAKTDGTLTGLRVRIYYDNGAAEGWHGGITGLLMGSTYRYSAIDIASYEICTNKTPVDAYRGPGGPQASFALESAIDELALKLGLDPIEFRLKNATHQGDLMADGVEWQVAGLEEALREARMHPVYTTPRMKDEGVGVAVGLWAGGYGPAAAGCRVEPDGSLTLQLGTVDISGATTGLAMIAAETFGISRDRVQLEFGDTGTAPFSVMSGGSGITYSVGPAVALAAADAKAQLLELAADELEASPADLELIGDVVRVKGVPAREVALSHLGTLATTTGRHGPIHGSGRFSPKQSSPAFAVHLCRLRLDRETGAYQVTDYVAIQDVGRLINPPEAEAQVHGGSLQGLGRAFGEQLIYEAGGQLRTGSFLDYEIPSIDQAPTMEVRLVEVPSPIGPLGTRGVGEPPAIPGPAAIANALASASGVRCRQIPVPSDFLMLA